MLCDSKSGFHSGDLVWVYRPNITNDLNRRKMVNPWEGPGQVLKVESATRLAILLPSRNDPRRTFIVHPDRLRRYQVPFMQSWHVEGRHYRFPITLLSRRIFARRLQYRVRWLSVEPTPDSWVDAEISSPFENQLRISSTACQF